MGSCENAFIAKMGSCENAFITKMGSCENALILRKELRNYTVIITKSTWLTYSYTA